MSGENIYIQENQECNENYSNNISSTENKSISNTLSSLDLRDKINSKRLQKRNNSDEQRDNFKIVINCQSEESNEVERRNRKIKEVFSSDDIELYKEYVQWDFITTELYIKGESLLNIVNNEEKQVFKNTLKSWFNIINEEFQEIPKYEYYTILPKITLEHPAAEILLKQLIENKFVTEKDANKKIEELLKFISTNHSRVVPRNLADPLRVEYDRDRNIVIVGKFKSEEVPRDNLISDKSGIISAARLMLRRESFGNCHSEVLGSLRESNKLEMRKFNSNKEEKSKLTKSIPNNELYKESERKRPRNDKIVDKYQAHLHRESNKSESRNCSTNKEENNKMTLSSLDNARTMPRIDKIVNIGQPQLPRESNKLELSNRSTNREDKSKVTLSIPNNELYKESERKRPRNDKIVNKYQAHLHRESNKSEWKNRYSNKEENNKVTLSSPDNERTMPRIDKIVNIGQSQLPRESNELEWRSRPREQHSREDNKVILSCRDIDLYKEYVQWDFINNKLYTSGEYLLNVRGGKQKQEFTNTLQRWFIFINEDFNDVPKYEYFSILPDIQLEHPAAQFLRTAIIEKEFATEDDADWKVRGILSFISRSHSEVVPHNLADPLHVEHNKARKLVVVNKFQIEEVPRVNLLATKGGVIATARMLLRYESFGNGSYQWGDPEEVHKVLYDKFNVRYEGFASPVNSRFIEYDNSHFCSLFPETDAVFGSIGNFFHVDMEKHSGGWSVNPPFLNDLMKNVAIRINEVLDAGHKCYFFCTFPNWDDDEGWNILDNSRHLLKRFNLPPQHFIVQDAYGSKFKPNMSMNLFVMGELPPKVARLSELGNILVHNSREALSEHCPW